MLDSNVFWQLAKLWGKPTMDLFASRLNCQISKFASWKPDPDAVVIDAFSIPWSNEYYYMFPPFSLITRCVQKNINDQSECLIILPLWPTQIWYPLVMELLIQRPVLLPRKRKLLSIPQTDKIHPLQNQMRLIACRLSGEITKVKEFREMQPISYLHLGEEVRRSNIQHTSWRRSTQKQYATYISKWILFCDKGKINSVYPTLNQVLEFLNSLFESGLSYSAINSARSALSAYGINFNHVPVESNAIIIRFMKGVYNLRPSEPKYCKTWDVSNVLGYLRKLSPIKFISLKDLTLKLVMLKAIITASRVQSLHLLTINSLEKNFHSYTIFFDGLLKQNRPSWSQNCIELFAYPPDERLCVTFVLKQ